MLSELKEELEEKETNMKKKNRKKICYIHFKCEQMIKEKKIVSLNVDISVCAL